MVAAWKRPFRPQTRWINQQFIFMATIQINSIYVLNDSFSQYIQETYEKFPGPSSSLQFFSQMISQYFPLFPYFPTSHPFSQHIIPYFQWVIDVFNIHPRFLWFSTCFPRDFPRDFRNSITETPNVGCLTAPVLCAPEEIQGPSGTAATWWLTHPEKYESMGRIWEPIYDGK